MDNNAPVIDTKKNAAKFYKVVETYIKRDGINDLMDWLGSTDFFEAPASTRFHGSYEGGLCQHSLNVGKWLNKLAEGLYPGQYTKETLTLVALFHDVCKANCYKTSTRNVKNEQTGQWEKVPFFAWEERRYFYERNFQYPFFGFLVRFCLEEGRSSAWCAIHLHRRPPCLRENQGGCRR